MPEYKTEWNYSPESEQAVIGSVLLDNSAYDRIADLISPRDFYQEDHRIIYQAMIALLESGKAADVLTVSERIGRERKSEKSGGPAYLAQVAQNTPSAHNVRRYAEVVRERAVLRSLYVAASAISQSVVDSGAREVKSILDEAQSKIMAVSESSMGGRADFAQLSAVMTDVMAFVDKQFERHSAGEGSDVTGLPTGFSDLDQMTTGFHGGDLVIVAARPSMGKSAFSLNIAEYAARSSGRAGVVFSMEMGNQSLGLRMLAGGAGVNVQRLVSGRIYDAEWERISNAVSNLQGVPLLLNETAGLTVMELRALARRAKRDAGGLSLVVVDYLQLMQGEDSRANRSAQISDISRGLKLLAKELDVPVVALSQLNRELETRTNKRPVMSDLRDSGAIEQDADLILFIYRDEVYHPSTAEPGEAEIIIAKQRNGPIGTVRLTFRADQTRFMNFAKGH